MTQRFQVHPDNPQLRLIRQATKLLQDGGLIVYPTDSSYALGCHLGDRAAAERIERLRQTGRDHNFTLVCRDLSEIATYARVDNSTYRLLRSLTPGPYTFILRATREVPRRLQNPKRQTIGIRVPDHPVPAALLAELGEPLMSSTLLMPGDDVPLSDPDEIIQVLQGRIDLLIDSGHCGVEPSTVVDLTGDAPVIVRRGKGPTTPFE
ncbi:MAG: threonylcarbamoyl-AMP synthase [Chromatiales bacterium]|jgi:tRNA threonylcarbamoyl adenosine modification protein (Sua5/YciO/YrdC/YwlC family)|nr:threonylcarbamoyl-AMP synthase [Chromatiales bacterium]